jgi:hypothetical protein
MSAHSGHDHDHAEGDIPSDMELRVKALESLLVEKGLADRAALQTRKAAWAEAHRATPYGQPVVLGAREQR